MMEEEQPRVAPFSIKPNFHSEINGFETEAHHDRKNPEQVF